MVNAPLAGTAMTLVLLFVLVATTSLCLAVLPWVDEALDEATVDAAEPAPALLAESTAVPVRSLRN